MMALIRRFVVLGGGVLLMLIGAVVLAFRPNGPAFGWTSYAPLSDATYAPPVIASPVLGLVLVALGFAAVVGWIGFEVGRSRPKESHDATPAG